MKADKTDRQDGQTRQKDRTREDKTSPNKTQTTQQKTRQNDRQIYILNSFVPLS